MKYKKSDIVKWCKALDSGKYKQGFGQLQQDDGYCCLGVACLIFIPKNEQNRDQFNRLIGGLPYCNQPSAPEWLTGVNYDFNTKTGRGLFELNDGLYQELSLTFPEIATVLELVYIHNILD